MNVFVKHFRQKIVSLTFALVYFIMKMTLMNKVLFKSTVNFTHPVESYRVVFFSRTVYYAVPGVSDF